MPGFSDRLREQIDFLGLSQKDAASRAGVKKRALDMYLGGQQSIPRADVAVKLAKALNVTVEYLVTGKNNLAVPQIPYANSGVSSHSKQDETITDSVQKTFLKKINELDSEKKKFFYKTANFIIERLQKDLSQKT